ncbi:MAG TPA: PPA1309 family protein [Marmoricola sp.]|nr:PPA1309 family protein [Marmoricola sp.]
MTVPHPELAPLVRELEQHAAGSGWDRPAQLFALVPTADLIEREPGLAALLEGAGALTPVEQDDVPGDSLEDALHQIVWGSEVMGVAAIAERLMEGDEEVRVVAAAHRDGGSWCALRMRSHDDEASVLVGPDLVPGLVELLASTLEA